MRMTCHDARDLASQYVDGELPEELVMRLERHLLRCAGCREEAESLRLTVEALKGCRPPAAGETFIRTAVAELVDALELDKIAPVVPGQLRLDLFRRSWEETSGAEIFSVE